MKSFLRESIGILFFVGLLGCGESKSTSVAPPINQGQNGFQNFPQSEGRVLRPEFRGYVVVTCGAISQVRLTSERTYGDGNQDSVVIDLVDADRLIVQNGLLQRDDRIGRGRLFFTARAGRNPDARRLTFLYRSASDARAQGLKICYASSKIDMGYAPNFTLGRGRTSREALIDLLYE